VSQSRSQTVSIVLDRGDPAAAAAPVQWAIGELRQALDEQGVATGHGDAAGEPVAVVAIAGSRSPVARQAAAQTGVALPDAPESCALLPATIDGRRAVVATGSDARGIVYAALELADRVRYAEDAAGAVRALQEVAPVVERPANAIRSVMRLFASDVEDLGWYHDRAFWGNYLTMLARQRFNRFQLALGIGFDFAVQMLDTYFYFPYPFLLDVPGYDVRATGVSAAERERNLDQLRFIARETKRRGLHFQLGLWAHVYVFEDSPNVNHRIEGLRPKTHAPYCREALRTLLQAVPEIDGVTLRVHGESGIPEGSYDFWRTLMAGIAESGRTVELDLHAKGIDQPMIDLALATGQPTVVSPKFWAEHLGLPYHQADIRAMERPGPATGQHAHLMALSAGTRRFTRYGYADLLPEDRRYGILWRVWPGTHRLLLWGDPVSGRLYSRAFGFCGTDGAELFEPLSFSGRRGSGLPNGRNPYADASLWTDGPGDAWRKYRYSYRLWGRLLYNPDADGEAWRRPLRRAFGPAAADMEAALGVASRILPLVTTAHGASAGNNSYWPEIYTDMPIVSGPDGETRPHPYRDTPSPKRFGTVTAMDPEVFSGVEEYVDEELSGRRSGRYPPPEVARWLEQLAGEAVRHLNVAAARVPARDDPEFRRWAIDVRVEAALGRFFAAKLRAATGYALYLRTGDVDALAEGLDCYRAARAAWVAAIDLTRGAYKEDLTFGPAPHLRGHWADRLAALDHNVTDMAAALEQARAAGGQRRGSGPALADLLERRYPAGTLEHTAPTTFTPGAPLAVEVGLPPGAGGASRVLLHYRHVNQAERYQVAEMAPAGGAAGRYRAEIPAEYTRSPFPLQYFFQVEEGDRAWRWPGLGGDPIGDPIGEPYFVVRARAGG
jgi:hypothetical protein